MDAMEFGDWYHKRATPQSPKRDLCRAEWQQLPARHRREYTRVDDPAILQQARMER